MKTILTGHRHGQLGKEVVILIHRQTYLSSFVGTDTTAEKLDVYQIMKAAGQVEALLKLSDFNTL